MCGDHVAYVLQAAGYLCMEHVPVSCRPYKHSSQHEDAPLNDTDGAFMLDPPASSQHEAMQPGRDTVNSVRDSSPQQDPCYVELDSEADEVDDCAAASTEAHSTGAHVHLYSYHIVYHPSYRVPVLYFSGTQLGKWFCSTYSQVTASSW